MKYCKLFFIFFITFASLFFCFIPQGVFKSFGFIEFESIVFHFFMPQKDMAYDWLYELKLPIILTIVLTILLFCFFVALLKYKKTGWMICFVLLSLFGFDYYYIDKHFFLQNYILKQYHASNFIKDNYVSPKDVNITFPAYKRNLIFVQVESLESSFQDKENGGLFDINYIPEMTVLAQENTSFSASSLIEGAIVLPETGWTMGGLIAETAGIPLKSYKIHKMHDQIGNSYGKYQSFLSGVTSLGDILKSAEYKNYFILGSSKYFAGLDAYLSEHGAYIIYDIQDISKNEQIKKSSIKLWGLWDKDVYDFSKQKLLDIAQKDKPFAMIIQTIDSHREGFLHPSCASKYEKLIENVYACVSSQLNAFISWCKKQDFFKDTTIVIIGDHYNMSTALFNQDTPNGGLYHGTERKVYNAFINPAAQPVQMKNRLFSTMDMFPTILAALGAEIDGNRLGLGTNLFSDEKTLLEKYDYDYLSQELRKKSNFYNKELLYPR